MRLLLLYAQAQVLKLLPRYYCNFILVPSKGKRYSPLTPQASALFSSVSTEQSENEKIPIPTIESLTSS